MMGLLWKNSADTMSCQGYSTRITVVLNQSNAERGVRQDGPIFNSFFVAAGEIASSQEHQDPP
jgi:hypothetical protein